MKLYHLILLVAASFVGCTIEKTAEDVYAPIDHTHDGINATGTCKIRYTHNDPSDAYPDEDPYYSYQCHDNLTSVQCSTAPVIWEGCGSGEEPIYGEDDTCNATGEDWTYNNSSYYMANLLDNTSCAEVCAETPDWPGPPMGSNDIRYPACMIILWY